MVIHARTEGGDAVRLTFHPLLQWAMGILSTLVTASVIWGIVQIQENDKRITAIEASRFTTQDAAGYVTIREYDAWTGSVIAQLGRIEDKLDALSAGR